MLIGQHLLADYHMPVHMVIREYILVGKPVVIEKCIGTALLPGCKQTKILRSALGIDLRVLISNW